MIGGLEPGVTEWIKETEDIFPAKLSLCREMRTFIRYFTNCRARGRRGRRGTCFREEDQDQLVKSTFSCSKLSQKGRKDCFQNSRILGHWICWGVAGRLLVWTKSGAPIHRWPFTSFLALGSFVPTMGGLIFFSSGLWEVIIRFHQIYLSGNALSFLPSHSDLDVLLSRTVMLFCYNDNLGSQKWVWGTKNC